MAPSVCDQRRTDDARETSLLIEKGVLLLGSLEFQIERHLMANGVRIDPETRLFLAQLRDAAGAVATETREKVLTRLEEEKSPNTPFGTQENDGAPAPAAPPNRPKPAVSDASARGNAERPAATKLRPAPECTAFIHGGEESSPDAPQAARRKDGASAAARPTNSRKPAVAVTGSHEESSQPARHKLRLVSGCAALVLGLAVYADPSSVDDDVPAASYSQDADLASSSEPALTMFAERITEPAGSASSEDREALATINRTRPSIDVYPDPRAGMTAVATMPPPEAEEALELSRRSRLEVQRRLALADFDPQLVDGIFGPATRAAISAWQETADLPPTGYLDETTLALLTEETADKYRAWRKDKQARDRQRERPPVLESPVPTASPGTAQICRRSPSGEIVYGDSVRCDARGLGERLRGLRTKFVQLVREPETVRASAEPERRTAPGGA